MTYAQLRTQYLKRLAAGKGGQKFLRDHPNFAKAYAANQAKKKPGTTPPGGGGTTPPGNTPPGNTPPADAPAQPTDVPPEGYEWYWNGNQWSIRKSEGGSDEGEKWRQKGLLNQISNLLSDYFSPEAVDDLLVTVIKPAIAAGQSEFEVMRSLRASATYKAFFPEYDARIKNGHAAWSEAQILQYRDQGKNLAKQIWGKDIKGTDLSKLIANNVSLQEFEHRLLVFKQVNNMGGAVQGALERELGVKLTDKDLYEFFDPEIDTSELDAAWENAIFKQYVNNLTGGDYKVTDEMVKNLRKIGVTTNQAIQNYQKMAGAMPAIDKLASIDAAVGGDRDNPFDSFGAAFGAYQTLDAKAQAQIGQMFARETARFSRGGGAVMDDGLAYGLRSREERR